MQFIGTGEESGWDGEAERLGCFEIDDQLEFRWLLDRQLRRISALQDFIHIRSGAPAIVQDVWAIGHQASGFCKDSVLVNSRQTCRRRELDDPLPMLHGERI